MKRIIAFVLIFICMQGTFFMDRAESNEMISIPKNGILEKPVSLGKEIVAYRDDALIMSVYKDTTITKNGYFLMMVKIKPSEIPKNQAWMNFVNAASYWTLNRERLPISPIEVDYIVYGVLVNETDATWKIGGFMFMGKEDGQLKMLYSARETDQTPFVDAYAPLSNNVLMDTAYRKIVQWHMEH